MHLQGTLALVSVVSQIVVINCAVNYCGARMCGGGDGHTYCKYRPGASPLCVGYIEAQLSADEKTRVLARLNRRRSEVARGWRHWAPAGDMLKLRWIEELSREAQRWADQCRPPRSPEEHDGCRDLYSISVGQCVASVVGEAPGLRPESMVDMWFMQSVLYDGNVTSYIPATVKNYYGDFAQIMWSRTHLVGCGRSRFMVEWRGRLRSVERLVCNFAPRGPVPNRPLWAPAEAASMCPRRSHPDVLPGLCSYQNRVDDPKNISESISVQDNLLLDTVFEIEKNKSLDYLGSLDELYLTKIAVATIGTPMPEIPLYYSLQKRDILEQIRNGGELTINNKSSIGDSMVTQQLIPTVKPVLKTKLYKTKANIIGRPKPYDINELSDALWEQNIKNLNDIQDLTKNKENDLYAEYGLVEDVEDDIVNNTTTTAGVVAEYQNENATDIKVKSENNEISEVMNATDGMVGSVNYDNINNEDTNGSLISNKTVEDYLSDPETVRALQDALDQMERTLASPAPVSTPGKVRRELRNLQDELQSQSSTEARQVVTEASEAKAAEATMKEERNPLKDKGPMLSMVLKYMPYLKPYESSIVGDTRSYCSIVGSDLSVVWSFILPVFVL